MCDFTGPAEQFGDGGVGGRRVDGDGAFVAVDGDEDRPHAFAMWTRPVHDNTAHDLVSTTIQPMI